MARFINLIGICILIFCVHIGISYAKKIPKRNVASIERPSLNNSYLKEVFSRIKAKNIGSQTVSRFSTEAQTKLNEYAELVISKTAFQEQSNPLYIDNPDLHRALCFLITSYVYEAESQKLPPKTQIYIVSDQISRNEELSLEIKNVQQIFDRCQKLELKLETTGMIYFNWDIENYLNGIPISIQKEASSDVPEEFKNDPLLSKLFKTESDYGRLMAGRDYLEDDLVQMLLEGVKNQLASGQPNLLKLATKFGKEAGTKLASRAWKERKALVASLAKDDSNLFSTSGVQKETALALTRLVAIPGKSTVSNKNFVNSVKKILDSDLKLNVKVGKEMLYVGFKLQFK